MKLKTQFTVTMLLFGIVVVAISVSAVSTNRRVEQVNEQWRLAGAVAQGASELSYLANDYVIYQESQQHERWHTRFASFLADVARLQADDAEQSALVQSIQANALRLEDVFDSVVSAVETSTQGGSETLSRTMLQVSWSRMAIQSQGLVSYASHLSQLYRNQVDRLQRTNTFVVIALIGVFGAYFLVNDFMIRRRMLRSIATLHAGSGVLGSGDLDFRVEEGGKDEIGDLSRAFNRMAADLNSVTASKADLETEITRRSQVEEELRVANEQLQEQTLKLEEEIEERIKVGAALQESEEKYRSLFTTMAEGFGLHEILLDARGKPCDYRFLEINEAFEKLTGLSRERVIGRTVRQVLPDIESYWIETYGQVALTGEPARLESYSASLDRWYETYAYSPQKGQFAAVFVDVTERRKLEDELRRAHDELEERVERRTRQLAEANQRLRSSQERFRQLAENIDDVFWMVEPATNRLLYLSPAFDRVFGLSRQVAYQNVEAVAEVLHPDDRPRYLAAARDGWQSLDDEFRIVRADGSLRWSRIRAFPVRGQDGQIYRVAGTAKDITAEKRAQEALVQAERMSVASRLAASLAHEINNPLQSAIGCLDLAIERLEAREDPRPYLDVTVESLEGTARVVQQLRVLNRPQPDEAKVPVQLNELVERALVLTQKRGLDQHVRVVWEPGEGLEALPIMPLALQQVFHNLIVNAFQAMPEGGQLRVTTARTLQPDGVSIAFADTGCGIAPEMRTHLFDAFHSTKSEGVGLGLFISHDIVLQHDGRIEVESELDQGTTFTVWLPQLPREQPSTA